MALPNKIKLVERKLGREKALGLAHHSEDMIEICINQSSKERLDTVIHEILHLLNPNMPEKLVNSYSNRISKVLWKDNWRKITK
jgi:hypothetical protein